MGATNRLTAIEVKTTDKPGRYADGGGLWLQVTAGRKGPTKAWLLRFMMDGRARQMGLGRVQTRDHDGGVTLAEARIERDRLYKLIRAGIDPIDQRLKDRAERRADVLRNVTFRDAAKDFLRVHEPQWVNAKHRQQWRNTLRTYAYPAIGATPVAHITDEMVTAAVAPIWLSKPETAGRVKQRIKRILTWIAEGRPLPAQSKANRVKHHKAMPWPEVPAFVKRLRGMASISARALEWTILTAGRTGDTIGATWDEIDTDGRVWVIPAERMKANREHRVPLTDRMLEVLASVPREDGNPHVFIGALTGQGLSQQAMLECVRGTAGNGFTTHGFRSTFRDWAAERTTYPSEVVEMAMAHIVRNPVERAYRRGDLFDKRRGLMRDWDRYCSTPTVGGTVVSLAEKRA